MASFPVPCLGLRCSTLLLHHSLILQYCTCISRNPSCGKSSGRPHGRELFYLLLPEKLIGWVQNKLHRRQEKEFDVGVASSHYASMPNIEKKEHNDRPQHLLVIGTCGTSELNGESWRDDYPQNLDPSEDFSDIMTVEIIKLQKELKRLVSCKSKYNSNGSEPGEEDKANWPLNRFLNCPSSLGVDRTSTVKCECFGNENHGDLSPNTKIILNKVKGALHGNCNTIKKNSISFLFKKMFVCGAGAGFVPPLSLKDPIPESRMEKILRAVLTKKMCHHNSPPATSQKYLGNKSIGKTREEAGDEDDKKKSGSKWVKTDSEFIVLEM